MKRATSSKYGPSAQAAEGAKRASRGGLLTGALLAAAAGALAGADRLQRQVAAAARQAGPQAPGSPLWPLLAGLKAWPLMVVRAHVGCACKDR